MQVDIQCSPSNAIAYCSLDVGEKMRVESGAMAMMSAGLEVSVDAGPGGIAKGFMRKQLAHESFFMTTFTALVQGAWVAIAPKFPGDITTFDMNPSLGALMVEAGCLLGMSDTISDDVRFGGVANFALHEGVTMQKVHGHGKILLSSYGGIQQFQLGDGETMIVDTGHLIAFSESMRKQMRVGPLAGLIKSKLSGEGLVASITGPGILLTQTRGEENLRSWLMPDREGGR